MAGRDAGWDFFISYTQADRAWAIAGGVEQIDDTVRSYMEPLGMHRRLQHVRQKPPDLLIRRVGLRRHSQPLSKRRNPITAA